MGSNPNGITRQHMELPYFKGSSFFRYSPLGKEKFPQNRIIFVQASWLVNPFLLEGDGGGFQYVLEQQPKRCWAWVRTPMESLILCFKPSFLGWLFCCPTATTKALLGLVRPPTESLFMSLSHPFLGGFFCCPTATTKALLGLGLNPNEITRQHMELPYFKGSSFFCYSPLGKEIFPQIVLSLCKQVGWLTPSNIERW